MIWLVSQRCSSGTGLGGVGGQSDVGSVVNAETDAEILRQWNGQGGLHRVDGLYRGRRVELP